MESYTLQLNRTHLLFIPPLEPNSSTGTVVQVCLRSDLGDGYMRSLLKAEITDTRAEIYPTCSPPSRHP
ncbi:hypothetical protein OG21DRAFT_1512492 [Imleria badia]|nr:hypothetical protein OG21DRAFT_1512492 [Imleria badia]